MTETIVGLMDNYEEAEGAISDLLDSGFKGSEIGFLARDRQESGRKVEARGESVGGEPYTVERVAAGATLGGVTGLVLGLVALAIPGIGPLAAAGPVGTALAGGGVGFAAGGIIGGLTAAGVPEKEAPYYAEAVRRGGVLVTVKVDDRTASRAVAIMKLHGAVDIHMRVEEWRREGWISFDEPAETSEQIGGERGEARLEMEQDYRRHFQSAYPEGEDFDSHRSAYAFGAELAEAAKFRGGSWQQMESRIREEWECNNPSPWDRHKEAIRYAWERRARVHEEA